MAWLCWKRRRSAWERIVTGVLKYMIPKGRPSPGFTLWPGVIRQGRQRREIVPVA
jgi:hypothetical protein